MARVDSAKFSSTVEYRAVIRCLYLKGKPGKEIHDELSDVYGDGAPSYAQVKFWVADFKRSRVNLEDEPRPGRPVEVTNDQTSEAVRQLVVKDRRMKGSEMAKALDISEGSVHTILHDRLGMRKLSARWVPKCLSDDQKAVRASMCQALLTQYSRDADNFMERIVTGDETWVHHYDLETKEQSKQWTGFASPRPKKFKTQPSAGKVMATIFWDTKGVLLIDYLPRGQTITGEYYSDLLDRLRTVILAKRRGKITKGVLLQHDNAKKKKELRGRHFRSVDELTTAVEGWLHEQPHGFCHNGLLALTNRWTKCIDLNGDYVEKEEVRSSSK
ncbi:histone-lysine N-methyltransferase SETMAR-like [Haliotis rufescens]|uniref:histone-lysine N-methyltransferase SETMAR-like n=1 Tax=Haliotis rufescens TaxID=6454 RepID=UPI00201EE422|nr:histone-lysine N-methyltransferase SETMAR-like [Haliotis rufescens]